MQSEVDDHILPYRDYVLLESVLSHHPRLGRYKPLQHRWLGGNIRGISISQTASTNAHSRHSQRRPIMRNARTSMAPSKPMGALDSSCARSDWLPPRRVSSLPRGVAAGGGDGGGLIWRGVFPRRDRQRDRGRRQRSVRDLVNRRVRYSVPAVPRRDCDLFSVPQGMTPFKDKTQPSAELVTNFSYSGESALSGMGK